MLSRRACTARSTDGYGQRWQVETDFSVPKRLLDAAVRSRRPYAINRDILPPVVPINLRILLRRCHGSVFPRERPGDEKGA